MATNNFCLQHSFKNFNIDAKLSFDDGEILALFGKSGSGKSTILKLLAGLIGNGYIKKSELAFLFQECTLFDNFSVYENLVYTNTKTLLDDLKIAFKIQKTDNGYYQKLLKMANLNELKNAKINSLSGGQKQRLALICALSKKAKYILLDEPFSALDDSNKIELIRLIKKLNDEYNCTIIFVSHSCFEIYALADFVYFIDDGKVEKRLSKAEFYAEKIQNNEFLCLI